MFSSQNQVSELEDKIKFPHTLLNRWATEINRKGAFSGHMKISQPPPCRFSGAPTSLGWEGHPKTSDLVVSLIGR
jgi:hypothetical protein